MAVGSLFSCQLWICCVPEFLGDFLFQTVWEGSHNQINLADRNHFLINLFSEDACIDPCASLEGRSFWHGQPGFKCCVPLLCFHVTRINGCFFSTCSVSMAGHVGVVGRGRGAAKSFTLECSHSPSAAERDEANLRHRNRVCCRLVPVSPTWTTKSSLRNEELCNKSYPKSWEL